MDDATPDISEELSSTSPDGFKTESGEQPGHSEATDEQAYKWGAAETDRNRDDLMVAIGVFLSTGRFAKLKGAYVAEAFTKHTQLLNKLKGFGGEVWQFRGYYRWRLGGRVNVIRLAEIVWPHATDWQRGQWQPFIPGQNDARRRVPLDSAATSTEVGEEG